MCFSRNHLHPVGHGEHRGLGKPSGLCPAQDDKIGPKSSKPCSRNWEFWVGPFALEQFFGVGLPWRAVECGRRAHQGCFAASRTCLFLLYYWQAWTSPPFFLPLFRVIQLADLKGAPLGSLYVSPGSLWWVTVGSVCCLWAHSQSCRCSPLAAPTATQQPKGGLGPVHVLAPRDPNVGHFSQSRFWLSHPSGSEKVGYRKHSLYIYPPCKIYKP